MKCSTRFLDLGLGIGLLKDLNLHRGGKNLQPREWCKDCDERIDCIAEEKGCRAALFTMEMVLGDYARVFVDDADPEDARKFLRGCEIICSRLDLDTMELDVDRLIHRIRKKSV